MVEPTIILFDGVCNLCNGFINFLIDRDPDRRLRFGALQSEAAADLLQNRGAEEDVPSLETVAPGSILVFPSDGAAAPLLRKSDAVLHIAAQMSYPWKLLAVFKIVPRVIRDFVYDQVAARRYRWFGRRDTCRIPTPDLRSRFIEDPGI